MEHTGRIDPTSTHRRQSWLPMTGRRKASMVALAAAFLLLTVFLLSLILWAPAARGDEATTAWDQPELTFGPPSAAPSTVKLEDVEWAGLFWGRTSGTAADSAPEYRPAAMLSTEVEMRVTGLVARTRLTQHFHNDSADWVEGVYLFPLPEDAAVDGLRLVIGDRVLEGEIQEKAEARRTYDEAKAEGRKASLVEQHRPNVFTTRVANVGPGEAVEVVLEMQQAVRWDAGEMSLRFPTVVNPRYFPAPGETGLTVEPPLLASAVSLLPLIPQLVSPRPVNPVRFEVRLDAGFPLEYLEAPYHRVDVETLGDHRFRVRLAEDAAVSADRDFELVWAPRPGDAPRAAVFREEYQGETYSLLMVLPPDTSGAGGWAPLDRELVFILDVSGSMHGAAIEQAKRALNAVLDGLDPGDSFNVIAFSDRARALFPDSLAAAPEAVGKARGWVAALEADGGTNMLPALAAALEGSPGYAQPGSRTVKQVIFLTDGAVGNEAQLFAFIASHLGAARLFTVGIGAAPNGHFMRRAAEEGRGTYTFIGDPAEVALKVEILARKLESPVLTDLELRWDDPSAETWPRRLGDLYAGEPLVVAARTVARGDTLEVAGRSDGSFWHREVALTPATSGGGDGASGAIHASSLASGDGPTAGVRQLWARQKIAGLMAGLATGVDPATVRSDVIEVALRHHLVSAYTSLVAVDVTPQRPAGVGLEGRRVPGAIPAGWTPPGTLPMGSTAWPLHLVVGLALVAFALLSWRFVARGRQRVEVVDGAFRPEVS